MILSACSPVEEARWKAALQTRNHISDEPISRTIPSAVSAELNLKPCGGSFSQAGSLTQRLSIQRAATSASRGHVCQVIIRNTHNPLDLQDFRAPSPTIFNRSQSHLATHRITVLAPKRFERCRLESFLSDVWTRDKLPYPGMISSRSGQVLRASAGSLVRKFSLASMHSSFTRRSSSLTAASQRSFEALGDTIRRKRETSEKAPLVEDAGAETDPGQLSLPAGALELQIAAVSGGRLENCKPRSQGSDIRLAEDVEKEPVPTLSSSVSRSDSATRFDRVHDLVGRHAADEHGRPHHKRQWGQAMSALKDWSIEAFSGLVHGAK